MKGRAAASQTLPSNIIGKQLHRSSNPKPLMMMVGAAGFEPTTPSPPD
jgi:hypothetical protein